MTHHVKRTRNLIEFSFPILNLKLPSDSPYRLAHDLKREQEQSGCISLQRVQPALQWSKQPQFPLQRLFSFSWSKSIIFQTQMAWDFETTTSHVPMSEPKVWTDDGPHADSVVTWQTEVTIHSTSAGKARRWCSPLPPPLCYSDHTPNASHILAFGGVEITERTGG